MHEMSIAQSILEIVEEAVQDEQRSRVTRVFVRIGELVAVVPESLDFCYNAITEGTPLAGSQLVIDTIPVTVCCDDCEREFQVESFLFRCPKCAGTRLRALAGRELELSEIEVE